MCTLKGKELEIPPGGTKKLNLSLGHEFIRLRLLIPKTWLEEKETIEIEVYDLETNLIIEKIVFEIDLQV